MVLDRPITTHRILALCLATFLTSACIVPRPPPIAPMVGEFSCETWRLTFVPQGPRSTSTSRALDGVNALARASRHAGSPCRATGTK